MHTGTQFIGTLPAGATQRWFTFNWPPSWQVLWTVVPTDPIAGQAQLTWTVAVELASATEVTHWITVTNDTSSTVTFEGRYAVMNG